MAFDRHEPLWIYAVSLFIKGVLVCILDSIISTA